METDMELVVRFSTKTTGESNYINYPQPKGLLLILDDSSTTGICYSSVIVGTNTTRTSCPSVLYFKSVIAVYATIITNYICGIRFN